MSFVLMLAMLQLASPSDLDFASHLMAQGDYFRAITEFKRVAYFSESDSIDNLCWLQIAKCYRKSHKTASAVQYSTMLLQRGTVTEETRSRARFNLGLAYLDSRMPQLAKQYLVSESERTSTPLQIACAGLADLQMKQWEAAMDEFDLAASHSDDSAFTAAVVSVSQSVRLRRTLGHKSPLLASTLSLLLPGAGQFYSKHYYDAVQSFLFTASFAAVSLALYRFENDRPGGLRWTVLSLSITGLFHGANVLGANLTAKYRNWKLENDLYEDSYRTISGFER